MGEDTDGMVESTSKLRDLVKGITGFDIMQDEQTYKSIYEIVLGIGEVWKDLSDIDQAALLEKLAGKTQSNALAAALNNVDILKEAYASAENSEGSATQEQQRFSEGIQYRINQFNEAREALSHTLIDSDLFKGFVDGGTKALEIIDQLAQHIGGLSVILTSLLFAKGFTNPKVGMLGYFVSIGTEVTKLISLFGKFAKIEALANIGMTLGKIGTAALGVGAVVALSAAFTTAYKAYDNYIHKYSDSMDAMRKHTSGIEDQKKEIDSLNEEYQSIQDKITEINNLGGAKVSREGELEQLQAQSKELERQIALKKASVKVELGKAYKESQKATSAVVEAPDQVDINAIEAGMSRDEYIQKHFGIYGGSRIKNRTTIDNAIPWQIKQYDALIKKRQESYAQVEKLTHDESGLYSQEMELANADEISKARELIDDYNVSIGETREQLVQWYNDVQERADVIKMYEEYGHVLTEDDKATIALAESTKDQIDAMDAAEASANGIADTQSKVANSVVKTTEQMQKQKAAIDQLLADYKEIQELSLGSDGSDVVLDDEQLQKYGAALEYVNGVYQLNQEKLLELANQRNQTEIDSLNNLKKQASLQYLQNIQDIERYNELLAEGQKTLENGDSIESNIANLKNQNAALLQQTDIYNYYINQLENVTSAYQRWLNVSGQEVDSARFMGVQDASKSALDIIKSGKVGTEKYQVALDFLIPDGVDREDADAVKKYINKNITPYFTEDETGIKKFLKEASSEAKGIFSYDSKSGEYTLNEGMTTKEIMKRMGWSEDVVRAMFDQLKVYGADFEWDVEGLHTTEEQLMHTESELEKLNQEKEKYNNEEFSEENNKKIEELNEKIEEATKHSKELRDELKQSTVEKIDKKIEENGGLQTLWGETKNSGKDPKEVSQELVKMLDISSPIELQLYTEDAEEKVRNLQTEIQKLYEQLGKGTITQEEFNTKLGEKTADLETKEMTLELLQQVILEDAGITTEQTVKGISSTLDTVKGLLSDIYGVLSKDNPGDNGQQQGGNGGETVIENNNGYKQPTKHKITTTTEGNDLFDVPESIETKVSVDTSGANKNLEETEQQANETKGAVENIGKTNTSVYINDNFSTVEARAVRLGNTIANVIRNLGKLGGMGGGTTYDSSTSTSGAHQVKGNAFARGNDIVGEQGRELVVDPNRGIWYTVGDSGTEMIDLPKDAIIYSHNQTEALLKSGVTTRGKSKGRSFANGTEQQYVFGNIDLRHRQPYYWDDGSVSTVLGTSYGMDELSFAVATLLQGNDVRPLGDGEIIWYLEQLVSRSHDPETIYALDRQGFTDPAGNWLHDLIAYVGTDAAYAEYVSSIMHVISDEYERSIGTYARGNAFANGTLVGERGRELVVDPNSGRWYTVGDYGSEMINLPKDAIVYNHQQTESLLKNGHTGRGHSTGASFAEGNAYVHMKGIEVNDGDGIKGNSSFKFQGGASSSAAKSAEKAAKAASDAAEKAKDATDEAKNNMIWIDRAIEHQERKVSKINELVEDDFQTYTERLSDLGELREELALQNEILSDALERRVEEFDKAFQELVEIFGEDMATDLLHKIEVGSVDKDTYKDEFGEDEAGEKKKKALDKVIDAYDEEVKLSDKLKDNEDAIRDAIQKEYEFRLNILEAEKDQLQFEMDTLEHNLDMKDVLGKMVVEGDYQDMIDQSEEIADNIQRTIDVLEEQLTTVDEGSAKYNEINSQLISAKKELQDIEKNQAEWNDKIMRLPIERIDRYINMLNNIKKDLENWSAEQNVLGIDTTAKTIEQRFDIAQRAIKKYNEQIDKYRDLLSHYEYGSDKFEETANSIQDCEDNVSSLIQEMRELNIQFLKLPIDDITKANEKLQNINAAEQKVLDDYDTALSAVLSKFDQLIDKRNDEIDILNKRYDEMIKPYQDQLDLLNEQNEAKQMQYNIDKAQYDLDKARQQKNVQVVRNGRIEYDSDIDALKSAQDNLNNAKHDKAVYDLQQQIDALEKERDAKIEPLEKEIDKLEDARNRWQTFEDERTFEKEAAEAVRLLGANWEKAIEGTITNPHSDDKEYDIFSKNHIQLDRQITNNEKQIENNERMIDLMTRYVDAYMSGEMTYEEARSQYDKLYKDYQSGATLTSQESLAAELAFNRAKDMGDALRLNNAETKKSYDSFLGQLEKANEYNKTIDKYTKTWDEINESITKQLAELERLAALAEEIAAQRRSSGGGRSGGGDSDGGGGVWSKNPTGYGAGTKYNPYGKGTLYEGDAVFTGKSLAIDSSGSDTSVHADSVTVISSRDADTSHKDSGPGSSSRSSGKSHYNHSSASGPASDPDLHHADGLEGGMIGNLPSSEKFKKLQAMGLKPLEPDEVPAFLHVGEGVVNAIQQGNILKSIGNAFKAGVASIPTDAVKSVENNYTFDCQFGDFILPNVQDSNGFASAMKNNFESIMNQQFSKIF